MGWGNVRVYTSKSNRNYRRGARGKQWFGESNLCTVVGDDSGKDAKRIPLAVRLSTGKNAGHAGQQLEQIVNGSSSVRVGAELLAQAD